MKRHKGGRNKEGNRKPKGLPKGAWLTQRSKTKQGYRSVFSWF
jgi:hypothetical protein